MLSDTQVYMALVLAVVPAILAYRLGLEMYK